MKKKKILVLFPVLGLLLSGCTFQEGLANAKSWVSQHIYHPIKDWISGGGNKEEPSDGGGQQEEKTLQEIVSVSAPATIKKGETLAPSSVDLVVKYSDKSTEAVKAESVDLDTSTVGDAVQGTAHYKALSKTFTIKVYEEGGEEETDYGTEDSPLSVTKAIEVIEKECSSSGDLTKQKLFVQGVISSVDNEFEYETPAFELHVADPANLQKVVYVYRVHCTAEQKAGIVVGATLKFSGFAKNYNGTLEFVDNGTDNPCTVLAVSAPSDQTSVDGVFFDETSYEVSVGGTKKVSATVSPLTATNKNVTYSLDKVEPAGCVTISGDILTGVAEGKAEVIVTTEEGGFTAKAEVKVVAASENQMVEAYNAALGIGDGETEQYTVQGVIVAKRQNNEWFIQSQGYGIEYYGNNSDFAVGKEVKVVSTFQNYKGLPETKTIDTAATCVIKEVGEMPEPVQISSVAKLEETKLNVLSNITGVASKDASDYVSTNDYTLTLTTEDGEIPVFIKKGLFSEQESEIKAIKAGDTVSLGKVVTSIRDTARQALFCVGSTITVVPAPEKEIAEYGEAHGPASIYQGESVKLTEVTIDVTYTDGTQGTVNPTSIDPFDNETPAKEVTVTVHYNEIQKTFKLEVLEKPASTDVTATSTIAKIAEDNSWANATQYLSFDLDSNISVSATGGSNTGKYYSDGNQWRLYQTESPTVTISAKEGTIKTVKVTYVSDKTGAMLVGTNTVASGDVCAVNAASFSFGVGNTGTVNNGQVRVTELEVVYEVPQPTVSSVVVTPAELALDVGMPGTQLSAVVNGDNEPSQAVTWSSSDPNVASVSETGVVTAVAEGSANIIATSVQDGETTGVCAVTVSQPVVPVTLDSLTVSGTFKIKYAEGELLDLTGMVVTANYSNDTHATVTSEDYEVSIAADHQLVGSDVSFTVSYNQVSSDPVTISVGTLSSVAVKTPPTKLSYETGDTIDLTGMVVTLTYSNEYSKDVEEGWTTNIAADHELTLEDTSLVVSYGGISADAITLTITAKPQPVHAGTAEDPYTIKDCEIVYANAKLDIGKDIGAEVYVSGTIVADPAPAIASGRGKVYISDSSSENTLYIHQANNVGGTNDLTLADIPAGSEIVAKGTLKNYNGAMQMCYVSNVAKCEFISIVKPVVVPTSVSITSGSELGVGSNMNLAATVGPEGAAQDVEWTIVTGGDFATLSDGVLTGVAAGDVTVRATAVGYESVYAEKTITVSSSVVPTEQEVYTLAPTSGSNNSYAGNCDIAIGGVTWNLTGNSTTDPWRIGGKSLSGVDRTLYSKTGLSDNISKIEIEHGAASNITVNSMTVIVSKNDDFSNPVSTLTPEFVASSKITISRPDGADWSNCYFKFVYNVSVSGTSNKFIEFKGATFYAVK